MAIKYSIGTGEVIPLDIEDVLRINFSTSEGKEVMQEILSVKDYVNHYVDYDEAIDYDNDKYITKKEFAQKSFEEYKKDIYLEDLEAEL